MSKLYSLCICIQFLLQLHAFRGLVRPKGVHLHLQSKNHLHRFYSGGNIHTMSSALMTSDGDDFLIGNGDVSGTPSQTAPKAENGLSLADSSVVDVHRIMENINTLLWNWFRKVAIIIESNRAVIANFAEKEGGSDVTVNTNETSVQSGDSNKELIYIKLRLTELEKSMLFMTRMLQDRQWDQHIGNADITSSTSYSYSNYNTNNGDTSKAMTTGSVSSNAGSTTTAATAGKTHATAFTQLANAITTFPMLSLSMQNIERCSVLTSFVIGALLGATLLDRLWLIGGITAAFYTSHTIYQDNKAGYILRKVGVSVLQLIRDMQEKYNQLVIFYRTGKLAYHTSKTWEKYDGKFSISQRMYRWKRHAMERAIRLNTTTTATSSAGESFPAVAQQFWQQAQDGWKKFVNSNNKSVMMSWPSNNNKEVWWDEVNQKWQQVTTWSKEVVRKFMREEEDELEQHAGDGSCEGGASDGATDAVVEVLLDNSAESGVGGHWWKNWLSYLNQNTTTTSTSASTSSTTVSPVSLSRSSNAFRVKTFLRTLQRVVNNAVGILLNKAPTAVVQIEKQSEIGNTKNGPWPPFWTSLQKLDVVTVSENKDKVAVSYKSTLQEKAVALLVLLLVLEVSKMLLRMAVKSVLAK